MVRYADVDPATLGLSAATVEPALTGSTRAVVATHLYGRMCDVEGIVELCRGAGHRRRRGLRAGRRGTARRRGGRAPSATAAAFSFYPTKNLGAARRRRRGASRTTPRSTSACARCASTAGRRSTGRMSPGGRNSRLDELQAAVLRVGLARLDERNERRREIVRRYADALPSHAGRFVWSDGEDFVGHLAVILAEDRDACPSSPRRAPGSAPTCTTRWPTTSSRRGGADVRLPGHRACGRARAHASLLPELTDAEVDRVCGVLREL